LEVDFDKSEDMRKKVEKINYNEISLDLKVTMSIGVVSISQKYDLNDLLKRADEAMYISKSQGRNRTTKL
jgi:diguanylate cyclase (GGDEF)-like protein